MPDCKPACFAWEMYVCFNGEQIESRACVDISRQQIVCGVKAWELRTGNVNLLTLPRLAAHHLSHRQASKLLQLQALAS